MSHATLKQSRNHQLSLAIFTNYLDLNSGAKSLQSVIAREHKQFRSVSRGKKPNKLYVFISRSIIKLLVIFYWFKQENFKKFSDFLSNFCNYRMIRRYDFNKMKSFESPLYHKNRQRKEGNLWKFLEFLVIITKQR